MIYIENHSIPFVFTDNEDDFNFIRNVISTVASERFHDLVVDSGLGYIGFCLDNEYDEDKKVLDIVKMVKDYKTYSSSESDCVNIMVEFERKENIKVYKQEIV